jgi:hypothetical protein
VCRRGHCASDASGLPARAYRSRGGSASSPGGTRRFAPRDVVRGGSPS